MVYASQSGLYETNFCFVGVTSSMYRWYPQPNNPLHQHSAVAGLDYARGVLEETINKVTARLQITRKDMAVIGYSAGGVMAIELAVNSEEPFGAVVCHNGAILEPRRIPRCKTTTPFFLTHRHDDLCFGWHERYLPMRHCLLDKKYNVYSTESDIGGHAFYKIDSILGGIFISHAMGMSKITHPEQARLQPRILKLSHAKRKVKV